MYLKSLGLKLKLKLETDARRHKLRKPNVGGLRDGLSAILVAVPPSVRSEVRTETTLAPAQNSRRLADQKESFPAILH
jgi:hypothetical protein